LKLANRSPRQRAASCFKGQESLGQQAPAISALGSSAPRDRCCTSGNCRSHRRYPNRGSSPPRMMVATGLCPASFRSASRPPSTCHPVFFGAFVFVGRQVAAQSAQRIKAAAVPPKPTRKRTCSSAGRTRLISFRPGRRPVPHAGWLHVRQRRKA